MKGILRHFSWLPVFVFFSCEKDPSEFIISELTQWPQMEYPSDNQPDGKKIALGERLFLDPILSLDSSISCSSCHKGANAMADNLAVSPGVGNRLGKRNSPSLWNIGFHPYFMREGGVPTLEMQVLVLIQEHTEMAFNIVLLAARLNADLSYKNELIEQSNKDKATRLMVDKKFIENIEKTNREVNCLFICNCGRMGKKGIRL